MVFRNTLGSVVTHLIFVGAGSGRNVALAQPSIILGCYRCAMAMTAAAGASGAPDVPIDVQMSANPSEYT